VAVEDGRGGRRRRGRDGARRGRAGDLPDGTDGETTGPAEQDDLDAGAGAAAVDEGPLDGGADEQRRLLLVVGDLALSAPEQDLRTALQELGFAVEAADDDDEASAEVAAAHDVVVISKTVHSVQIADTFLTTPAGVVFWEDNAQAIEQGGDEIGVAGGGTRGLATIDVINPESTSWHLPGTDVHVNPDAPAELRAGLSGPVTLYREPAEMTFAPVQDGRSTVAPSATWVAEHAEAGSGRYVYYVIDADAGLADGTRSHGRRVYFGLYDETFPLLTAEGRALFEAAVDWAATAP
jgi:hypothetical protein